MENVWGILTIQIVTGDLLLPHPEVEAASLSSIFETWHGTLKKKKK